MRKTLAFLLFPVFLNSAHAQLRWGANAGVNISSISQHEIFNPKPLFTLQFSGVAMICVGNSLLIQPSLGYKGKGFKTKTYSDSLGKHFKVLYNYLQLSTPVLLRCNANDSYKLYAGGGP